MGEPRIVTVFGATGQQGDAVVRGLVLRGRNGKSYKVRAVTRNTQSPKAEELRRLGAQVVRGDLDDVTSVKNALEDASACFLATNFWLHMNAEIDTQRGINVAIAAKQARVGHVIYSGQESIYDAIRMPCEPFDAKAKVESYMFANAVPFTSLRMPNFYENFLGMDKPKTGFVEGTYEINLPLGGKPMYGMSIKDIGPIVRYILDTRGFLKGQRLGLASSFLTGQQYADILSRVLAPKVFTDSNITVAEYKALGFPGASDLGNMFIYYQKGIQQRNIPHTKMMHPTILSFEEWAIANKKALLEAIG